jgi:uncharacterized protein YceK
MQTKISHAPTIRCGAIQVVQKAVVSHLKLQSPRAWLFFVLSIALLSGCATIPNLSTPHEWRDTGEQGQVHGKTITNNVDDTETAIPQGDTRDTALTTVIWVLLIATPIIVIFVLRP